MQRISEWHSTHPEIALLLDAGHYKLAQLKPGRQWPKEWIGAEQASTTNKLLRGGGKISWDSKPWKKLSQLMEATIYSFVFSQSDQEPVKNKQVASGAPRSPQEQFKQSAQPSANTWSKSMSTKKAVCIPLTEWAVCVVCVRVPCLWPLVCPFVPCKLLLRLCVCLLPKAVPNAIPLIGSLIPKFHAIASMQLQARNMGHGLHVHPGSLGPRGFPFVCVKCEQKVTYPTVSCPFVCWVASFDSDLPSCRARTSYFRAATWQHQRSSCKHLLCRLRLGYWPGSPPCVVISNKWHLKPAI